tara:strand:+ start:10431 stop:11738 length:1308 start_codon:yes stop_codon:yes gene_type:complete
LEWRGSAIPKLVWNKSGSQYDKVNKERKTQIPISLDKVDINKSFKAPYWTSYRGPNSEGIYKEQPILTDWPKEGPKVVWRKLIGDGHSSFSIAKGLAFTIEQHDENEVIAAFSVKSGEIKWKYEYRSKFEEYFGGIGPRSTPTWHKDRLYTLGAKGHLNCLDANSGKVLWQQNIIKENKSEVPYWGVSTSPFIYKDSVILSPGGQNNNAIISLNAESGKVIWKKHNGNQVYSTPTLFKILNEEQLIVALEGKILSLNPNNGELLWSHKWKIYVNNHNIAQPAQLNDNTLLVTAGYGTGAEAFQIIRDGKKMRTKILWKSKLLKTKFSSAIYWDGFIYGLNESRLVCLNAKDGSLKWRGKKYGYGKIVAASGHLIILGDSGDLALVEMNPNAFSEKIEFKALEGGRTWNYPTLANGLLFIRNSHEMACFDLRINSN